MADTTLRSPAEQGPRRRSITTATDTFVEQATAVPQWLWTTLLLVLLAAASVATYGAGGTRTALPHLFYIPIILAALPFGLRGTVVTAALATILTGPLMPIDVAAHEMQRPGNWLVRGAFFLSVAVIAGLSLALRERAYERQITEEFRQEIDRSLNGIPLDAISPALLKDVLDAHRFHPVYQPIYSLRDGQLRSVEALTRFDTDPVHSPEAWFAAAQESGRGMELELATIESALAASMSLPAHVALSVNASPATLLDPQFFELVRRQKSRTLIVEVTEHAVVTDYRLLQGALEQLRAHGVKIAVDDAGSGVSSLLHIVQLVPDIIKVDLSLAQDVGASPVRRALATCLVDFANQTGAELIVEGIEQAADLSIWADLGAHAVQGFLVGRPGALPFPPSSDLIPEQRSNGSLPRQRIAH